MTRCWLLVRHNKNMSGVQFVCLLMCVQGPVHSWGGTTISLCTQRSDYVICIGRLTFAFLDIWGRATPVINSQMKRLVKLLQIHSMSIEALFQDPCNHSSISLPFSHVHLPRGILWQENSPSPQRSCSQWSCTPPCSQSDNVWLYLLHVLEPSPFRPVSTIDGEMIGRHLVGA